MEVAEGRRPPKNVILREGAGVSTAANNQIPRIRFPYGNRVIRRTSNLCIYMRNRPLIRVRRRSDPVGESPSSKEFLQPMCWLWRGRRLGKALRRDLEMLATLIPDQQRVLPWRREIFDSHLGTRSSYKLLSQGAYLKRFPVELHPVVVSHCGVFSIVQQRPVEDSQKAVVRIPAYSACIAPFTPMQHGNGGAAVDYDGNGGGRALPARDHPNAR